MAALIRLHDLVNLSIGTPDAGAVNFHALHSLLHAMVKHLNIQDLKVQIPDEDNSPYNPPETLLMANDLERNDRTDSIYHHMEKKILKLEQQLAMLNSLPTGLDLMAKAKSKQEGMTPVEDMWCMMQMKKRLEANEDGVSQAMVVLQDLVQELSMLKHLHQEVEGQLQNMAATLDMDNIKELQQELKQGLSHMGLKKADKEDTERLEKEHQTLEKRMEELENRIRSFPNRDELNNAVQWEILRETLVRRPATSDGQTGQRATVFPSDELDAKNESEDDTQVVVSHTHRLQPSTGLTQGPSVTGGYIDKAQPITLYADKPCQTLREDLTQAHPGGPASEHLSLLPNASQEQAHPPGSPREDYCSISDKSRLDEAAHISGLNSMPPSLVRKNGDNPTSAALTSHPGTTNKATSPPHTPSDSPASNTSHRYADTMEALRNIGALSEEYATLQSRLEALEKNKADRAELTTLLCTTGELLQTVPDLQDKLNSLYRDMQDFKHVKEKGEDPLHDKILQFQEQCNHLNSTTEALLQDLQDQQRHIEIIYQTLEKLEEKKADKEKATELQRVDIHALESKVSRTQFDATTDQINNMMQDLLGRVSGQEQDWQRVLENINLEMQSKLDRMELDPLKNKLEERWREIRRQLQEKPPQYESDDAAVIRKQLVARFHCLSCDRPLDMAVPGPPALSIPNIPGLPSHRSNRPFTVYELDQIRQFNRSDRLADFADLGYLASARSCGGSHTTTFPQRRYVRMQGVIPCSSKEQDLIGYGLKEEVEILGSDGQIYHGRMDSTLPAIHAKEGKSKCSKNLQVSQRSLYASDNSVPPSRPQSAKSNVSYKKALLDSLT